MAVVMAVVMAELMAVRATGTVIVRPRSRHQNPTALEELGR